MILKKYMIVLSCILFFSCSHENKKETKSPTKNLSSIELIEGYFVKNTVKFESNTKHFLFRNKKDFDTYFGCAKTMNNIIDEINFDEFNVGAILTKISFSKNNIVNLEFVEKGKTIYVNYKHFKETKKAYSSGDLLLFKVNKNITKAIFSNKEETFTIE